MEEGIPFQYIEAIFNITDKELSLDALKINQHTRELMAIYLKKLIASDHLTIPTQAILFDWYTMLDLIDLFRLDTDGEQRHPTVVITAPYAVDMQCHITTALNWLMNQKLTQEKICLPKFDIYTGISDKTNRHSWLRNRQSLEIVEPTTIARETYFGYRINDPVRFVCSEFANICNSITRGDILGLTIADVTTQLKIVAHLEHC